MWKKKPACRNCGYCPLEYEREERLISMIFDFHSGGEALPCENDRVMDMDAALSALKNEEKLVRTGGKAGLRAVLRGGDPLARLDDLKELWDWIKLEIAVPVILEVTTDGNRWARRGAACEEDVWCRDRIGDGTLKLWLRSEGLDDAIKQKILSWMKTGACAEDAKKAGIGLAMILTPDNLTATAAGDILWALDHGIPLQVEKKFSGVKQWSLYQQECEGLLEQLLSHPQADRLPWVSQLRRLGDAVAKKAQETEDGLCLDTTGWIWDCTELSSLNLFGWDMNDDRLNEILEQQEGLPALTWICPGMALKSGSDLKQLQNIQHLELLSIMARVRGIKGLCNETDVKGILRLGEQMSQWREGNV